MGCIFALSSNNNPTGIGIPGNTMAREITRRAVNAFSTRRVFGSGNTTVTVNNGLVTLYLFGNAIAKSPAPGITYICSAGWKTATTKERLNGIPGVLIQQKRGKWYLNGVEWKNTENWVEVPRG